MGAAPTKRDSSGAWRSSIAGTACGLALLDVVSPIRRRDARALPQPRAPAGACAARARERAAGARSGSTQQERLPAHWRVGVWHC
jgi:hypothetical protein